MNEIRILSESEFEGLDEPYKALFKQNKDTKEYWPNIPQSEVSKMAIPERESISKLEAKRDELLGKLSEVKQKAGEYESLGKSAEEIADLLKNNRPEDVSALEEKYRAKEKSITESFTEKLTAAEQRAESAFEQLKSKMLAAEIGKLRADFDLNKAANYVVRDHLRVEPVREGSDELTVRVYENGQPALEAGKELTPEGLLKKWQESKQFPEIFNAGNGGGSGAPANQQYRTTGGSNAMRWSEFNAMPLAQQTEFLSKGGQTVPD